MSRRLRSKVDNVCKKGEHEVKHKITKRNRMSHLSSQGPEV